MVDMADLEARVRLLEQECRESREIEAIKRVKYRYWRCIDTKASDELEDCFTADAVADYGPNLKLPSRDAIVGFLKETMARFTGVHHGHDPEIEMIDDTTARGTWALWNYMFDKEAGRGIRIGGHYYDEYVKEEGEWKIKSTKEVNVFREIWDRET